MSNERSVTAKTSGPSDRNTTHVAGIPALVSLLSFFYYLRHNDLLLYGDAVAHINIARRVFDSQTPGLLQLGTVWLPLPHLLMIPFIYLNAMWQSGAGGSIPSMVAYVLGVIGIFRLVRGLATDLCRESVRESESVATDLRQVQSKQSPASSQHPNLAADIGAWAAAFAYGANPDLIYMQATAMTESIYLALFIWAVVYFAEFIRALKAAGHLPEYLTERRMSDATVDRQSSRPLMRSAACLAGAELTRYDGWFLAGVMGAAVAVIALQRWPDLALRRSAIKFLVAIALAPMLWLAYNAAVYGNALDFATGPYSAKAIEQRVGAPNPALHSAPVAAIYFLKSAQLNMAEGNWGRFWLTAAIVALVIAFWKLRVQSASLLLLWVPFVFYALSIAYGSVPLHVYTWWPHVAFNQRYGLQLLPMFAVSAGILMAFVFLRAIWHGAKLTIIIFALLIASYAFVSKAGPQCFTEAQSNWDVRHNLNSEVQRVVTRLPRNSMYLMDISEHVGIFEQAGIPLRQVVNNENHRPWKRPTDPEGLWERTLADPPRYVDFVIAFDGDAVDRSVNRSNLTEWLVIHASGQPHARIYVARKTQTQSR